MIRFNVKTSRVSEFTLNFRIPAWARGASVSINGSQLHREIVPGTFATIHREWRSGDVIELNLPMTTRVEPIDLQRPDTVALCYGPLALFAVTETKPSLTRADLLAAKRLDQRSWQVRTAGGPIKMLPFTDIAEEQYTTYLNVT
jgi:DUF1680 family protein